MTNAQKDFIKGALFGAAICFLFFFVLFIQKYL